jgi:plasmid maintenance system killer protein
LNVYIDEKELEKLYSNGFSKKLKLPELIIDKFFATIQKIEAASSIYDLWNDKGLNFEKLKGTKNRYSMRLSGKYRLEMIVNWKDQKETIGDFILVTISNHYGD